MRLDAAGILQWGCRRTRVRAEGGTTGRRESRRPWEGGAPDAVPGGSPDHRELAPGTHSLARWLFP